MNDNIRHSSSTPEHYTPVEVVEAARNTLGIIDLDPASCQAANRVVRATRYFTRDDNGFIQPWHGRVFLNPPGGWCDDIGCAVIKKSGDTPACTESGSCGIPAPHTHEGIDSSQKKWWQELIANFMAGHVPVAIFVCFSLELLQSTQNDPQGPLPLEFPICYPASRLKYTREDGQVGKSPPHSSCIICVTRNRAVVENFHYAFASLGHVVIPRL